MPEFSFLTVPTDSQIDGILALYRTAGWWQTAGTTARDRAQVRGIVGGSYCFLLATTSSGHEPQIIGMGRSISDGASDAYIQDVVVASSHRGRGIATRIIERIVQRLQGDGIEWIGLIAERNTQNLYRPLGFTPMTDATPMIYRRK